MRRLLERLFPFTRGARPACYLRENGPVAIEVVLLSASPRDAADAMLESGLAWLWRRPRRGWAELTRVSLSAFLDDLAAGQLLAAGFVTDPPADPSDHRMREMLLRFCRTEAAPVAAAIGVRSGRALAFVQQHAPDTVNVLMDAWGVDKAAAERHAYARLGAASLEALAAALPAETDPPV